MRRPVALALLSLAAVASAGAQGVTLELRPRAGDTLRMRLDQHTEITGARGTERPMRVTSTVVMHSRAIVISTDAQWALIIAVTDSMVVDSDDEHARALAEQARRGMEGRQVKLRLAPDGTMSLTDGDRAAARDVKDMVSIMPGSFPREPLDVGDTWERTMPIPGSAQMNLPSGGKVRARFRLDSLSRGGDYAYVSMRGTFEPANDAQKADAAAGSVTGSIVVNRRRGWLSESRFLIQMQSTMPMPATDGRAPLRFRTRITQAMRVLGERR